MYYLIDTMLRNCSAEECHGGEFQYVAVLSPEEWNAERDSFEMGIDLEPDIREIYTTNAEVNYDSVTGSFAIPDRSNISGCSHKFAFALDEKGIVFIDSGDTVSGIINRIMKTKKWRRPSLERFIYDFLEQIVHEDPRILENYEKRLDAIDYDIDCGKEGNLDALNDIRGELRDMRIHYNQLIDLAQEFEENENSFFHEDNLRFFRLFSNRVLRMHDIVSSLLDYSNQIRDTYQSRLDVKQNHIMTVLTVVTTVFMPLTLIVGWYGMNFKYMPELNTVWGYPVVIGVSVLIVVISLVFFKRKKWL
ncbi:Mg2+/Co2+ transporter [Lachnospiraceae bacterium JC7]|nr:Mg2+/Co2+ transporter [Lachnospiraceae bacterium JC7]